MLCTGRTAIAEKSLILHNDQLVENVKVDSQKAKREPACFTQEDTTAAQKSLDQYVLGLSTMCKRGDRDRMGTCMLCTGRQPSRKETQATASRSASQPCRSRETETEREHACMLAATIEGMMSAPLGAT